MSDTVLAPAWANWYAYDANGRAWWFENEPKQMAQAPEGYGGWVPRKGYSQLAAPQQTNRPCEYWRTSLVCLWV